MYSDSGHFVHLFYENKLFSNGKRKLRPAIFADRDGVLIKDKNYISNSEDVELEKGALNFLKSAFKLEIPIVIVTNQSGISRGFFSWNDYVKITEKMLQEIGEENPIIAIFANGLSPNCAIHSWRKPSPEMINTASYLLNIDKRNSILIGDRQSDIESGINAKISNLIHLQTGHGLKERDKVISLVDPHNLMEKKNKDVNLSLLNNIDEIILKDFTCLY